MKNQPQPQYKTRTGNNQLVLILNSEISLPEDAPVRVTSAQLEELDYRKLYEVYSSKGRKSATDPRVMFKVMVYEYQCGIFSTRALEDVCKYRIDFMWLHENEQAPITKAWYRCEDCKNCPQREKCCKKQDKDAPKEVILKETFWEKRQQSLENITIERGIQLRINRSIQVEGAFGLLKNDFGFRRFLTTEKQNVYTEMLFLAFGFNLKKRWMKQQKNRLKTHYSEKKIA